MGAAALGGQVVFQLFYLLPVLLQLHLELLDQAAEITEHTQTKKAKFSILSNSQRNKS